jgi:hypothetical protein
MKYMLLPKHYANFLDIIFLLNEICLILCIIYIIAIVTIFVECRDEVLIGPAGV